MCWNSVSRAWYIFSIETSCKTREMKWNFYEATLIKNIFPNTIIPMILTWWIINLFEKFTIYVQLRSDMQKNPKVPSTVIRLRTGYSYVGKFLSENAHVTFVTFRSSYETFSENTWKFVPRSLNSWARVRHVQALVVGGLPEIFYFGRYFRYLLTRNPCLRDVLSSDLHAVINIVCGKISLLTQT